MQKDSFKLSCSYHFEEIKKTWLELQKNNFVTVYQDYEWNSNWFKHLINKHLSTNQLKAVFITVYEGDTPVALFPLCIRKLKGVRVLTWLADDHFNYQGGIFNQTFLTELNKETFLSIWNDIEDLIPDFHVIWLTHQLSTISGIESPFGWIEQHSSPNSAHQLIFKHHHWDDLLKELRSKSTRKRMRNEESRLSREGHLSSKKISNENELEFYLDVLFKQREDRFKLLGIDLETNIESYKSFYLELLKNAVHEKEPFVYMMVVELDDVVLATILLAEKNKIIYPLINSMTSSEYHKWSPGDYLLRLVIQDACNKQVKMIDFGLSEDNNYKTAWCNNKTEIFETIKGKGIVGKLIALFINRGVFLKRKIKQSPKLWSWYCSFRSGKLGKVKKK